MKLRQNKMHVDSVSIDERMSMGRWAFALSRHANSGLADYNTPPAADRTGSDSVGHW